MRFFFFLVQLVCEHSSCSGSFVVRQFDLIRIIDKSCLSVVCALPCQYSTMEVGKVHDTSDLPYTCRVIIVYVLVFVFPSQEKIASFVEVLLNFVVFDFGYNLPPLPLHEAYQVLNNEWAVGKSSVVQRLSILASSVVESL